MRHYESASLEDQESPEKRWLMKHVDIIVRSLFSLQRKNDVTKECVSCPVFLTSESLLESVTPASRDHHHHDRHHRHYVMLVRESFVFGAYFHYCILSLVVPQVPAFMSNFIFVWWHKKWFGFSLSFLDSFSEFFPWRQTVCSRRCKNQRHAVCPDIWSFRKSFFG